MLLLLLLIGTGLVLGGLFTAASLFLQPTLYSEPVQGVVWRGPVAGGVVALVLGLWAYLALKAPDGRYGTLLQGAFPSESKVYDELWVIGPDGAKVLYRRIPGGKGTEAYQRNGRPGADNRWRSRPLAIFVKEDGQEVEFKADVDSKGKFVVSDNQPLQYRDAKGRTMSENSPGALEGYRWGQLFLNLLLNFAFFLALFGSLWLLLEYHFWHAFGLALALWVVLILFAVPPVLEYAESLGKGG